MSSTLRGSTRPLSQCYDVAMLDLDGVVYVGPDAVPGVPQALEQARSDGMRLAFVTNNAARTPQTVAHHLTELGIAAEPEEVITSSQAAARYLADLLPAGARVLVLGTTGLIEALRERGLTPVHDALGRVDAVVQGYSPTMDWATLSEGAVAINRRAPWVATNIDPTVPSPRGPLPGNGSLVKALQHATGVDPVVTGKPDPTMHRETVLRTGAVTPLVVGDRLDTDIEGANAVGCDSVLVFSGVTTLAELLRAGARHRPTYLGQDLSEILVAHPPAEVDGSSAQCGRWRATVADRAEPARPESARPEPESARRPESARPESARPESARPESARPESARPEPESARPGLSPAASAPVRVTLMTSGGVGTDRAGPERRPARSSSLDGSGFDEDQLDAIRALCAAIWAGSSDEVSQLEVVAGAADSDAQSMVGALGLDAE